MATSDIIATFLGLAIETVANLASLIYTLFCLASVILLIAGVIRYFFF